MHIYENVVKFADSDLFCNIAHYTLNPCRQGLKCNKIPAILCSSYTLKEQHDGLAFSPEIVYI